MNQCGGAAGRQPPHLEIGGLRVNKKILKMIGKRIVQSIIVVFIVTLLVFLLMQLVPGDPIVNFLGSNATEEQVAYYTELFGYDKPVLVQYGKWILGLFHGQMGRSVAYQAEISGILFQRLGITLSIVDSGLYSGGGTWRSYSGYSRSKEARKQTRHTARFLYLLTLVRPCRCSGLECC